MHRVVWEWSDCPRPGATLGSLYRNSNNNNPRSLIASGDYDVVVMQEDMPQLQPRAVRVMRAVRAWRGSLPRRGRRTASSPCCRACPVAGLVQAAARRVLFAARTTFRSTRAAPSGSVG